MNLDEFRSQNPVYADKSTWPDEKLATGLYNKYYKDKMSLSAFTKQVGLVSKDLPADQEKISDEQWQAYADRVEDKSKTDDEQGLEEPWVNPVDVVAGPFGMPLRVAAGKIIGRKITEASAAAQLRGNAEKIANWLINKSIAKTAAPTAARTAGSVGAALLAEPAVGTVLEVTNEAMTDSDVSAMIKLPANLAIGMVTGTLAETGIQKIGQTLLRKGIEATPESVFKALKTMKVDGVDTSSSEDVISSLVKRDVKPANMVDAVKAITKMKKDKGLDIPDIAPEKAGEQLHSMALGAGAGISQDEEGNVSIDPKLMVGGAIAGGFASKQLAKIIGSTRHPGQKGGVKKTIKDQRAIARAMAESGASPKDIFKATLLWQGEDGRWRYEIDDSKAVFKINKSTLLDEDTDTYLEDILDHPVLYEHWPQLRKVMVMGPLNNWGKQTAGMFVPGRDPVTNAGDIYLNPSSADIKSTLIHEVQHAVQHIEGLDKGGSPSGIISLDRSLRNKRGYLMTLVEDDPVNAKDYRKKIKAVQQDIDHIGVGQFMDAHDDAMRAREALQKRGLEIRLELENLNDAGKKGSKEYLKLEKEADQVRVGAATKFAEALDYKDTYHDAVHSAYERILGERESVASEARRLWTAEMRAKAYPKFEDSILLSKYLQSNVSATTGAIGAVYGGVDWDTFIETGDVQVNPDQMLKGLFAGVAVGMGVSVAPKAAAHWTSFTKNKIVDPLVDIAKGSITNETMRYQLGLGRSPEVKQMVRDYKRQSELVLRKAISIGQELNEVAPTSLGQRKLAQILEGGITTNPELAKKAHKINTMFKDLKEATRDLNLSQYSRFDNLSRKQRADLRVIIKDQSTPVAEVQTAQELLNNYYHTGSSKEYLPIFHPGVEGLTKTDKKALASEITNLKRKSRFQNPEGDQALEEQIAGLETFLHEGTKKKSRVAGATLDQGYATMRQDIPAEVTRVFNNIIGTSYRVAKGALTQGTDVLKMNVLNEVKLNPEWVLPKGGPTPANYVKLFGEQWGPLSGQRVRKDVLADLEEVIDLRSNAEINMDKIMGYWKYGKAILNPVTHARNAVSNTVLAYFAGVNPADTHTYLSAAKALKQGRTNVHFKEAEDWGLYNNTFIEADISVLRDDLNTIRDGSSFAKWIRKAASVPAAMYDQSERFFKTAVFIHGRENGMDIAEAANHAEKYLFNYQDIPPVVKHYKRWAAPFATYTYKAIPLLAETMITKPWKMAAIMGSMYGMEEIAKKALGATDEEVTNDKSVMLQDKGQVLLPFTDDQGNRLYGNVGAFMPWSGVGQTWGQSDVPLGDMLPTNPLFTIAAGLLANKEAFTGQEIHDRVLDSTAETTQKYMEFAWKQLVPSLAPGGYGFEKIVVGLKNEMGRDIKDYTGQSKELSSLAMNALLGVKLTPGNQELFDRFTAAKLRGIQRAVRMKRSDIRRQLERGEITSDDADEQMQALQDLHLSKVAEHLQHVK